MMGMPPGAGETVACTGVPSRRNPGSDESSVVLRFLQTDWSLSSCRVGERPAHPYPARFPSGLPRLALDVLGGMAAEGPVLDPFCGSGTTLRDSQHAGYGSHGVDLNPIACLVSRVRTQPWRDGDEGVLADRRLKLVAAASVGADPGELGERPPRLDHWFEPWAQRMLAGAVLYARTERDPVWADRLAATVSACVVRLGRQESDTRYAAVDKGLTPEKALKFLDGALAAVAAESRAVVPGSPAATVDQGDARDLPALCKEGAYAAAVFSPPYPNAYEYWLYHKYRMYWLGFDPLAVRENELGARPHYHGANASTEIDFLEQMTDVFGGLRHALGPGAPVVVVVGDSIIKGRHIDNGELLVKSATRHGFRSLAQTSRPIMRRRSSFNQSVSRARVGEHMLLLRRD